MRLIEYFVRGKDLLKFLRDVVSPPSPQAEPRSYDFDDDFVDEGPDCTGKIHRRYCRKFDRQVRELYWLPYDEVVEDGSYMKFLGGFHVPKVVTIFNREGRMVELVFGNNADDHRLEELDKTAIYLGPLPAIPPSLDPEW